MKRNITDIRKAVAAMANQLHKLGYTLSNAFKTAWRRVKESMTSKVSGVTYENRQELLRFISNQDKGSLTVYLKRDRANEYDKYAVAVVVEIKGIGYAHIGYLAKGLAQSFYKVIDGGISLKADIKVTGGYGYKETYGALVEIKIT